MDCQKCQKLVHFYEVGELDNRKARQVERHLKACPACREVAEEIQNLAATVRSVRELQPVLPHPEKSTAAILRTIRSENARKSKIRRTGILESLLNWVGTPMGRGALISAALIIIGLFITQEALVLHRLNRLEEIVKSGTRVSRMTLSDQSISEVLDALNAATPGDKEQL